jgi:DNA processing protein
MSGIHDARTARIALACLAEPGTLAIYDLVREHGPVQALNRILGGTAWRDLVDSVQARLAGTSPDRIVDAALARTRRIGARVVIPEDDEWPAQLADLRLISRPDGDRVARDTYPPMCLWVRGDWPLAETLSRSVAVVGARASTSYGNHVATELAYGLANRGWAVVSGGAFGIDAAAHRGALAAGGVSAAVLACGVDRPYPSAHANLFERLAEDGLLITEWPPGADPHRHRFLIRNRVIAALARGTVVVEANARSGARQTLGRAVLLGRATMAVPGPVTSAMSVGCHEVLREGVRLVTSYQEVLEEVGLIGDDLAPRVRAPEREHDRLGPQLSRVLDAVPRRGGADAGQIAATAGMPLREVLRAMPVLEELGQVDARDDGRYVSARKAQSPRQAPATDIDSAPPDEVGVAEPGEVTVPPSDGAGASASGEAGVLPSGEAGAPASDGAGVPASSEAGVPVPGGAGVAASDGTAPTTSGGPGPATDGEPGSTVPTRPGVPA